jgi:RNase P/RNase MRP subunit p29
VFVGTEWTTAIVQDRLRKLTGISGAVSLCDFLAFVSAQHDQTWIVQKRMAGMRHRTQVTQVSSDQEWVDGYVDLSVFLDSNYPPRCNGGVSRFAAGPVVNIGTGGGLAPLMIE